MKCDRTLVSFPSIIPLSKSYFKDWHLVYITKESTNFPTYPYSPQNCFKICLVKSMLLY